MSFPLLLCDLSFQGLLGQVLSAQEFFATLGNLGCAIGAGSEVPPSEAPFKGAWGLKGLGAKGGGGRRSEGRRKLHLPKASRGFKGA